MIPIGSPLICLAQAEHDVAAQSILITDDEAFAASVEAAVERQLKRLPRECNCRAKLARILARSSW